MDRFSDGRLAKNPPEDLSEREIARFWRKVRKVDGCWLWTGYKDKNGYGKVRIRWKWYPAHRVAYQILHGPVPEHLFVLHSCDVEPCVRDEHLFVGTKADNVRDMHEKDRARKARGVDHPKVRLTEEQVREIRSRYDSGESRRKLANEFGVHHGTVQHIVERRTWRWLS